ncbi:unnamed protein product [Calicophoron daubneyi]|uniref:Carboxylesterase type B domain-containing protein n=1 Tax=Calicophoron daubneyi TaxID=300641 RepID=A0AAV2SZR9_CALDB
MERFSYASYGSFLHSSTEGSSSFSGFPEEQAQQRRATIAPSTEIERPSTMDVMDYITLNSLLPNVAEWKAMVHEENRKRIKFLGICALVFLVVWVLHAPLAIYKASSLEKYARLSQLIYNRPGQGQMLPPHCLLTACAALCPESTDVPGWYVLYGVPYASLPRATAYFAQATYPYTFRECYLAYWHGVSVEKRMFIDGQIRFMGKQAFDDASECAQVKTKNGKPTAVGKPQACLTLSLQFPWYAGNSLLSQTYRNIPVVAYIGGNYLMNHRPRLISARMASELAILYVAINYRLGIFGFSDFNIEGSGPNHAVEDVRQALTWIQEYAPLLGADNGRVMLYGENSGATIAAALMTSSATDTTVLNGRVQTLFSHVWMADGSVVIPKSSDSDDQFREMVLHDSDLAKECKNWKNSSKDRTDFSRSHPLGRMHECLEYVTYRTWLEKTPLAWYHSRIVDQTRLPQEGERRTSIIKHDPYISRVENPLGMLHPLSEGWGTEMRNMPVVVFSTMNRYFDHKQSNDSEHWTVAEAEKKVKDALNSFRKPTAQLPYAKAIWSAYKPYLDTLIQWRRDGEAPHEMNYRALYDVINNDLRGSCAYNLYAKYLQLSRKIEYGPIYRILSRLQAVPYVDKDNAPCDAPFFLMNEDFDCGEGTKPLTNALTDEQREMMVRAFMQFAHYGSILGARQLRVPTSPSMPALETTYNIIGEMGITTAGTREIAMLTACKMWVSDEGVFDHVMKYARFN